MVELIVQTSARSAGLACRFAPCRPQFESWVRQIYWPEMGGLGAHRKNFIAHGNFSTGIPRRVYLRGSKNIFPGEIAFLIFFQ
jgi:hypothetical protein